MGFKSIKIDKLIQCIQLYKKSRLNDIAVYNRVFSRLEELFFKKTFIANQYNEVACSEPLEKFSGVKGKAFLLMRQLLLIPSYSLQFYKMHKACKLHPAKIHIIAIAANRIELVTGVNTRSYFSKLGRFMGSDKTIDILEEIDGSSAPLFLFDPSLESQFWVSKSQCWKENIFIIDGFFLVFASWFALLCSPFNKSSSSITLFCEYYSKRRATASKLLSSFEALIFFAMRDIVSKGESVSAVFFTSNSTLTEMLRFYLLQHQRSEKIVEVLHGILAVPMESYFHSVLKICGHNHKNTRHVFVPQIPSLPELKLLTRPFFYEANASVNGYINKVLTNNTSLYSGAENYYKARVEEHQLGDQKLILTIFGATSIRGSFFSSSGFFIELECFELVTAYARKLGVTLQLVYAPHPAAGEVSIFAANKLRALNVEVVKDSIFCQLISHYCITIVSSCLFEMNWLGAKCFTPLIVTDEFYSKDYLQQVFHPASDSYESMIFSLESFIDSGLGNNSILIKENFIQRVRKVNKDIFIECDIANE